MGSFVRRRRLTPRQASVDVFGLVLGEPRAVELGDEEAAATLGQLNVEAKQKREEALLKLRALASKGDERAKAMLESLQNEGEL